MSIKPPNHPCTSLCTSLFQELLPCAAILAREEEASKNIVSSPETTNATLQKMGRIRKKMDLAGCSYHQIKNATLSSKTIPTEWPLTLGFRIFEKSAQKPQTPLLKVLSNMGRFWIPSPGS